jgi:hypothetical protein
MHKREGGSRKLHSDELNNGYISYDFITMATQAKAGVCGRSLAGILGSNSAAGMDVCL